MPAGNRSLARGALFAFEGIDGCGKTTQVRLLRESLLEEGFQVTALKEPTDGPFGLAIRLAAEDPKAAIAPAQELRLFVEDRRQNVAQNILPALEARRIVLLDRYYLSTAAYQGARGLDVSEIIRENEGFAPRPDLFLLLDLDPSRGLDRIRASRAALNPLFEKEPYLERVAAIFRGIDHDRVRRFDASKPVDTLAGEIRQAVLAVLQGLVP